MDNDDNTTKTMDKDMTTTIDDKDNNDGRWTMATIQQQ
jgi:hypothetical protein